MRAPLFGAVHHVAIIASDYERSKAFYTQTLGFEIVRETYRAERASFKLDLAIDAATSIELFSFPNVPARPSRPEACGLRHLAFAAPDFDAAVRELAVRGVALEPVRIDELTGRRYTFFADPDDLPIEIYES